MKKVFILCLVALFMATGLVFAATPARNLSPGAGDIVAKHGSDAIPDKTFRLVRFIPAGSSIASIQPSLTADSIVIWDLVSDDGVTVTTTTTSNDPAVAGVAVLAILTPDNTSAALGGSAATNLGSRNFGWIQTYGVTEVTMQADSDSVQGGCLATGSHPGQCSSFVASTTSGVSNGQAGFYYDAGTPGGTDVKAFVKLN